ncbi:MULTISPECIES: TonB-dependent receptor [unclassified Novosphingobium]|uniref:TonB-dependent receptor domain-containing protein n=1 Tax=unclassified Novosphingobium TaxID=2644732 RepID=UPI001358E937|nr:MULTISPECIES: TonB-dependent receptor [unclassified Novosphingobium]
MPIRKQLLDELGGLRNKHERETFTLVGGFEGQFNNGWNWRATHQHGKFVDNITNTNLIMGTRFTNAVDVISDPSTGMPVCRSAEARAEGCLPVNLFERQPFSQGQRDYFVRDRTQRVQNTQDLTTLSLYGNLVELPHGPLSFAVGAERRKETLRTNDDPLALSGELYFFGVVPSEALSESFEVMEAYAEITAPVLGDLPFIRKLTLEVAIRVSDYSTIGTTTAWRAGANWQVNDDIRLRTVRSASVRAPNLFEMYQPLAMSTLRITNPCSSVLIDAKPNRRANCAAMGIDHVVDDQNLTTSWSGGNRQLKEEKSNSFSAGITVTPSFLPGLMLKADYYNIEIDGAVSSFTAQQYVNNCFDAPAIKNPFCAQIHLDENNLINEVYVGNINVAKLETSGIDFGIDYNLSLGSLGRLNLYANGTYLIKKSQQVVPDDASTKIIQAGEYTDPEWMVNTRISYMNKGFTLSMSNRYIGKSRVDVQSNLEYYDRPYVASRFYTDFMLSQRINEKAQFYIGINNAFNVTPPEIAHSYIYAGVLGGARYDNLGRYFHTGVNFDL